MSSKVTKNVFHWVMLAIVSIMIAGSAGFVNTVHATETSVTAEMQEVTEQDESAEKSDDATGSGFFLLAGGLLIIILAVVITVVSTFVSTAAIVDEL